jgi:glucose-6-phosphate isomerase
MTRNLFTLDVSGARDGAVGSQAGVRSQELDDLVERGRQVHDELLLARARGQIGFGDLYLLGREAMRARDAAESLGPRFETVALLAQGAEAEVIRAILSSLSHPFHNLLPRAGRAGRPRVLLVDSVDSEAMCAFLESFPPEHTLFVHVEKSGSDVAALARFALVHDILRKRFGPGYQDHLVVITDPRTGHLREEALRDGLVAFELPANVSARYSALTPVGLFPAAVSGIDVRGILAGAHTAAERSAGEDLRTNSAYLLAAMLYLLRTAHGASRHVFVAGTSALGPTAEHLAGLFEESAAGSSEPGQAALCCTARTLPRDALDVAALCDSASGGTAVVMIEQAKPTRDRALPAKTPGAPWLAGRNLSEVAAHSSDVLRGQLAEAGVPVIRLELPALTPNVVGTLHMTAMLAAAFSAGLSGGAPDAPASALRFGTLLRRSFRDSHADIED